MIDSQAVCDAEPMLDFVCRHLAQCRGAWATVSRASGVPYHTLTKIAQGQSTNPRISTIQRLHDYFKVRSSFASVSSGLKAD